MTDGSTPGHVGTLSTDHRRGRARGRREAAHKDDEPNGHETTERNGSNPSNGLAGKIYAAKRGLPDDEPNLKVLAVAQLAFDQGRHPAEVWEEIDGE